MQNFIDDGYTDQGYIAAVPGLHGELRFEYRPVPYRDRTIITDAVRSKPPAEAAATVAATIARFLVSWSFAEKIEVKNILRLRPRLVDGIYYRIMGAEASDPDPNESFAVSTDADAELSAILDNTTKEEVAVKN